MTSSVAQMKDPRDPHQLAPPPTQEEIDRAKAECRRQRIAAGADPDTGFLLQRVSLPMRPSRIPMITRVLCANHVDEGIERYGRLAMVRALCAVLAANGIDIAGKTLDELAQAEEEQ